MKGENKYSLYAYVAGRWGHIFSYPTRREAESARRFYRRRHNKKTKVVPVGTKLND